MNQVEELENLKSIKRKAKSNYTFIRTLYLDKLYTSSHTEKKIYFDAINALDQMYNLYQSLKSNARKKLVSEQIEFAEKWENYIYCIESITANKSNDKYLITDINIDIERANIEAVSLWKDYKTQNILRN